MAQNVTWSLARLFKAQYQYRDVAKVYINKKELWYIHGQKEDTSRLGKAEVTDTWPDVTYGLYVAS